MSLSELYLTLDDSHFLYVMFCSLVKNRIHPNVYDRVTKRASLTEDDEYWKLEATVSSIWVLVMYKPWSDILILQKKHRQYLVAWSSKKHENLQGLLYKH